jgi:hypothetical protein
MLSSLFLSHLQNLDTATVLDVYTRLVATLGDEQWNISHDDYEHFRSAWLRFDKKSSGEIHPEMVRPLLQSVGLPLGLREAGHATPEEREFDAMVRLFHLSLLGSLCKTSVV